MSTDLAKSTDAFKAMLKELGKQERNLEPLDSAQSHFLTGVVARDGDNQIRLYPNAQNPRDYYVIPGSAVLEYKVWSPEEVLHRGPAGGVLNDRSITRVYLTYGAEIRRIRMSETISRVGLGSVSGGIRPLGGGKKGGCGCGCGGPGGPETTYESCTECDTGCCAVGDDGSTECADASHC